MQSGHCRTKEKQRELLSMEGCGFHERFSESSRSYESAELQQHRREKAVYRLSRRPFLGKYKFAFAWSCRLCWWARRCDCQGYHARSAAERSFQKTQSSYKVVVPLAALVVGCNLSRGARCLRAFSDVATWACVNPARDSLRDNFPSCVGSSHGRGLAAQSFWLSASTC